MSSPPVSTTTFPNPVGVSPQPYQQPVTPTPGWNRFPGVGKRTTYTTGNPAAGAEVIVTVPGGVMWRLISARALLTTSVAVANRLPGWILDDGTYTGEPYYETEQETTNLTASSNRTFMAITAHDAAIETAVTVAGGGSETRFFVPEAVLLTMALPSGYRIRTKTTGLDAADQWSKIRVFVEEVIVQ